MVSAFLFLVPWVPFAVLRACEPAPASAVTLLENERLILPICCSPLGALVCPDGEGPSPPLPGPALREASRQWAWKAMEAPGWKLLLSDRFAVRGDAPLEGLRECAACLGAMRRSLGGDLPDGRFNVRIFAVERDFRLCATLSGAPNAESFYDPRTAEVAICLDPPRGPQWLRKTLAHELTHLYTDRVWRRTEPLWFAEGVAEYFAGFQVREGCVRPGAEAPAAGGLPPARPGGTLRGFVPLPLCAGVVLRPLPLHPRGRPSGPPDAGGGGSWKMWRRWSGSGRSI
jgi:hypothetical protein